MEDSWLRGDQGWDLCVNVRLSRTYLFRLLWQSSDEEPPWLMGRSEDGRPGANTSSIKPDGYGAPHELSEHAGMPQATANAGSWGNVERFQTFIYCGKMCYSRRERDRESAEERFLLHLLFLKLHCLEVLEINLINRIQAGLTKV